MKIYIASPYEVRQHAQIVARQLEHAGHTITARWLHPSHDHDDKGPVHTDWRRHALEDLEDVLACELFVVLNPETFERSGTGGRHVELGLAIATLKLILLIGERTNTFHHLPSVVQIDELADFTKTIERIRINQQGTPL